MTWMWQRLHDEVHDKRIRAAKFLQLLANLGSLRF
jgi:hypothetical protein